MQCQICNVYYVIVLEWGPSQYIFDIILYLLVREPQFEKSWLRTITLPMNFLALDFDYGIACNFLSIGV